MNDDPLLSALDNAAISFLNFADYEAVSRVLDHVYWRVETSRVLAYLRRWWTMTASTSIV